MSCTPTPCRVAKGLVQKSSAQPQMAHSASKMSKAKQKIISSKRWNL